jgi:hypothetical protein
VLDRLREIFGGQPADGGLGSRISLSGGIGAWQRAGGEIR